MTVVTKRLVDIDDQLLERAKAVSGEKTIKGTVEVALKKLANDELIMRHIERLKRAEYDLTPEEMDALRDPDYPLQPLRGDDDA